MKKMSFGTVPLFGADGQPSSIDALMADPACCGANVREDTLSWGPLDEIALSFDPATGVVTKDVALGEYAGALEGSDTAAAADGTTGDVPLRLAVRARETVDGVELSGVPGARPWASNRSMSLLHRMVAESTLVRRTDLGVEVLYGPEGFVLAIALRHRLRRQAPRA